MPHDRPTIGVFSRSSDQQIAIDFRDFPNANPPIPSLSHGKTVVRNSFRAACAGCALILTGLGGGCRSGSRELAAPPAQVPSASPARNTTAEGVVDRLPPPPSDNQSAVQPAAYLKQVPEEMPLPPAGDPEMLPTELEVDILVLQVLERNPDIRSATAAWRAAAQKYPQAISLDDPMFGLMMGPASWGAPDLERAYRLEASQKW